MINYRKLIGYLVLSLPLLVVIGFFVNNLKFWLLIDFLVIPFCMAGGLLLVKDRKRRTEVSNK